MQIPLKNLNIYIILVGIVQIALGYILMSSESFIDASKFSMSLYVSPPLIIIGHGIVAWGIIAGARRAPIIAGDAKFEKTAE
jgi:hypothetical protein